MTKKLSTVVIVVLIALVVLASWQYFRAQSQLAEARTELTKAEHAEEVIVFTEMFIDQVLKAENEVDFETRLKLETAVRNLENERILNGWQKFIESQTEWAAQSAVKNLLSILIDEIHK